MGDEMKSIIKTVFSLFIVFTFVCTVFSYVASAGTSVYAANVYEVSENQEPESVQEPQPPEEEQVDSPVPEYMVPEAPAEASTEAAVYQTQKDRPMVALTFDDGPHPQHTDKILEALKKYGGSATFFVVGSSAEKHKDIIKKIYESGNEIGNHSYSHKELTKIGRRELEAEIKKTGDLITEITGAAPILTRPTYGSVNKNVRLYVGAPLILWSIDTLDWKSRDRDLIVHNILNSIKDGDIVLLHDIYETTAEASEIVIRELTDKGFQLVTVSQLCEARGVVLEDGKVYTKFASKSIADNE